MAANVANPGRRGAPSAQHRSGTSADKTAINISATALDKPSTGAETVTIAAAIAAAVADGEHISTPAIAEATLRLRRLSL